MFLPFEILGNDAATQLFPIAIVSSRRAYTHNPYVNPNTTPKKSESSSLQKNLVVEVAVPEETNPHENPKNAPKKAPIELDQSNIQVPESSLSITAAVSKEKQYPYQIGGRINYVSNYLSIPELDVIINNIKQGEEAEAFALLDTLLFLGKIFLTTPPQIIESINILIKEKQFAAAQDCIDRFLKDNPGSYHLIEAKLRIIWLSDESPIANPLTAKLACVLKRLGNAFHIRIFVFIGIGVLDLHLPLEQHKIEKLKGILPAIEDDKQKARNSNLDPEIWSFWINQFSILVPSEPKQSSKTLQNRRMPQKNAARN